MRGNPLPNDSKSFYMYKSSLELGEALEAALKDSVSLEGKLTTSSQYILLGFSCLVFGNVSFLLLGPPTTIPIKKVRSEVSAGAHRTVLNSQKCINI